MACASISVQEIQTKATSLRLPIIIFFPSVGSSLKELIRVFEDRITEVLSILAGVTSYYIYPADISRIWRHCVDGARLSVCQRNNITPLAPRSPEPHNMDAVTARGGSPSR